MNSMLKQFLAGASSASDTRIIQGEPIRVGEKHLIPIFRISASAFDACGLQVYGETSVKGVVAVEKGRARYIPLDDEVMALSTLRKDVPGLAKTLSSLTRGVKMHRNLRRTR